MLERTSFTGWLYWFACSVYSPCWSFCYLIYLILMADTDSAVSHYCDCWPPDKKQFDLAKWPKKKTLEIEKREGDIRTGQKSSVCCWQSSQRRTKASGEGNLVLGWWHKGRVRLGNTFPVVPSVVTQQRWVWEALALRMKARDAAHKRGSSQAGGL